MEKNEAERGLYTPDDMLWQINREGLLLFAGSRAVLLEVAHPLVAAGVATYSNFARRPLKRLFNTVRTMQMLSFGDMQAARKAARHVHQAHRPVQGTLGETTGGVEVGTAYDARDPELGLWVFATLVDSILLTYEKFIEPLTDDEKAQYYEDSKRMAYMLGVPPQTMPDDYEAFRVYVAGMLHSDELTVGETGREIAEALFSHPIIGPLAWLASQPGIGTLPARLRKGFGLAWSETHRRWVDRVARFTRWLRPKMPDLLMVHPQAWWAERRYKNKGTGRRQKAW